ncbi:zinc finger CCHC-type and RNA-binding motif-containing protein 1-like [Suncus etruscus]|uniref:zinc finger CCHC-type and RNA-binding motif-containing protein 1-like n=1 Tax=Suncus etruscus TaxID=109475 RepID=UPI0021105654|nr:zinc finger CCHC-type and RNA-binding motif-containing protein 1-like [Suncus etruscus]
MADGTQATPKGEWSTGACNQNPQSALLALLGALAALTDKGPVIPEDPTEEKDKDLECLFEELMEIPSWHEHMNRFAQSNPTATFQMTQDTDMLKCVTGVQTLPVTPGMSVLASPQGGFVDSSAQFDQGHLLAPQKPKITMRRMYQKNADGRKYYACTFQGCVKVYYKASHLRIHERIHTDWQSTVYVSNLPFSLTNNDLYRIFSKYGKVVKVTIMKDKDTRKSKGVAFILFLDKDSAQNCTRAVNNKQLFGRVIKASIAIDNGRAAEFIRRRNYFDKSKCYECGESGHLSYACPKNMLGEREPPKKKEKKKKKKIPEPEEEIDEVEESEDEGENPALDSLSQAIAFQQAKFEEEQSKWKPGLAGPSTSDDSRRPRIKKSTYFSNEEELSD